jgi:hypothetical protein
MSNVKAYCPEQGQKYQILTKYKGEKAFEHCDYAKDKQERDYLLGEYRMAYGSDFSFKTIELPKKYWGTRVG